ncbi:MAG: caspase family protein [Rhodospirillaceae bacterium]
MILAAGPPSWAEGRVALVIGNSNYRFIPRLDNPTNDARAMADALRESGFLLVGDGAQIDIDKSAFDNLTREFGHRLTNQTVGLFYFAGHAVQVHGINYLAPVQANPKLETDVKFDFVDANTIVDVMAEARNRFNIIILDSCRNNPWTQSRTRSIGGGLAQMRVAAGMVVSYSTQPGNVASDGVSGHSPYTESMIESMKKPGLDVYRFFNDIGLGVKRKTNGEQQPWISMSPIEGEFFFHPQKSQTDPAGNAGGTPVDEVDYQFWTSIKNTENQGLFREYLRRFPNGAFIAVAKNMLEDSSARSNAKAAKLDPQVSAMPVGKAFDEAMPGSSRSMAHDGQAECDRLASGPKDQQRLAPGVERNAVLAKQAIIECRSAVFNNRHNLRLQFQLARSLDVDEKIDEAAVLMEFVASQGYTAAESYMGWLYEYGRGVPKNHEKAIKYYTLAIKKGDAYAKDGLYRLDAKLP